MFPADGIFEDITNAEYHASTRVSNSDLTLFNISPCDYYAFKMAPERPAHKSTPALELGTAVHMAVLEPALFSETYLMAPPIDRRTKAWKEFAESVGGRKILSSDDFAKIEAMASSVRGHPIAGELIEESQREVSALWTDRETGVPCRARPDVLSLSRRIVLDLKTTADVSYHAFSKSAINYKYHRQGFWYSSGLNALTGTAPGEGFDFAIIAVQSSYPFTSAIYELDADLFSIAEIEMRDELRRLSECRTSGLWPTGLEGINTIRAPEWMKKKMQKPFSYLDGAS